MTQRTECRSESAAGTSLQTRSVRAVSIVGLCAAIAFSAAACHSSESAGSGEGVLTGYGSIALEPCQLAAPGMSRRVAAECGTLDVPEDRTDPDSRTISLSVAVRRAVVRNKALEPVLYLAGGPGQSAIESYVILSSAFAPLRRRHDIVLVDQRGTGTSSPLDCPESGADGEDVIRLDLEHETVARLTRDCLESIEEQGIDPRQYTTSVAIDDLEAVREALGVPQVNLVGISYGTRVAQSYAARYPEKTRSLVLDGVVPQDMPLGGTVAADAQRALDALLSRCSRDAECREAFGSSGPWSPDALNERLRTAPAIVQARHPQSGEMLDVEMTPDLVAMTIRLLLYSSETSALLPLLLDTAADGDMAPLAAQFLMIAGELDASMSGGMGNSVACAEDVPRLEEPEASRALKLSEAGTFLGDTTSRSLRTSCAEWPIGELDEALLQPLRSDVPTLLLSGEWDPVTPPSGAEHVLSGLSSGLHLVAPGQGHGIFARGCAPTLVADFVEAGSVVGLQVDCLDDLVPMPFFTSFAGPNP